MATFSRHMPKTTPSFPSLRAAIDGRIAAMGENFCSTWIYGCCSSRSHQIVSHQQKGETTFINLREPYTYIPQQLLTKLDEVLNIPILADQTLLKTCFYYVNSLALWKKAKLYILHQFKCCFTFSNILFSVGGCHQEQRKEFIVTYPLIL